MTFLASTGQAITALEEAARRTRMQRLSADPATGVLVFTAGRIVLAFGEKVTARIREVKPGIVQVTLSSNLQFGLRAGVATAPAGIGWPTLWFNSSRRPVSRVPAELDRTE